MWNKFQIYGCLWCQSSGIHVCQRNWRCACVLLSFQPYNQAALTTQITNISSSNLGRYRVHSNRFSVLFCPTTLDIIRNYVFYTLWDFPLFFSALMKNYPNIPAWRPLISAFVKRSHIFQEYFPMNFQHCYQHQICQVLVSQWKLS